MNQRATNYPFNRLSGGGDTSRRKSMSLKEKILKLRKNGKTYNDICDKLQCSKRTVAYYCASLKNNTDITRLNSATAMPAPSLEHEDTIRYLVETGTSRPTIADALKIDFKDLVLFCKRKNIKSKRNMFGYLKVKQHRRNKKKILAAMYLGGRCVICGYDTSYKALDFHHKNPKNKDFTICTSLNKSWANIKAELDKCELLCANCHRERHDYD